MKILMALMGLDIGGAETHVVELTKELNKRGHTVIVASNGGVYVETLEQLGIRHYRVPMHRREPRSMLIALNMLKKLITDEKPDIVHAHARIPAFLCGILHRRMKFPFITSAHGVFQITPLLRLMTDWGQRTVSVSEDIKEYLMKNYQLHEDRIHVTINGIDTEHFSPRPGNAKLMEELGIFEGPVICTVGRLDSPQEILAEKLIAVMPDVLEEHPEAQLLIVGGGDQEERLRAQAEQINQRTGARTVVMTGARTDVAELVSLGDIFVGVSRAALEAMAMEKPVILGGGQGYMGIFYPELYAIAKESNFCCRGCAMIQEKALLQDLSQLLKMKAERCQEICQFGRRMVQEHYSLDAMTDDYLEAYQATLHPKPVIKAVVSGYYGYKNLGDDAVLLAILKQLEELPAAVRVTVLSRSPEETAVQYGVPAVSRFSPYRVIKALRDSDMLISGGGSLLQDKTSTRSLIYYLAIIRLAQFMGKPVFLYANGIGPLSRPRNRRLVRRCIQRCDAVTLRDGDSLEELRSLGVTRRDICVTGDPALKLGAYAPHTSLVEHGIPQERRLVGISVRNIPNIGNFPQECAKLCDRLIQEKDSEVVFLVMQEAEDLRLAEQIRSMMEETSHLLSTPGEPLKMLSVIRELDVVFAMRLHAAIFAAGVNVPIIGCVYDPKVESFLSMMEMPSCGTPQDMTADEAYSAFEDVFAQVEEYKVRLHEKVEALLPETEKTVEQLQTMLIKAKLADENM